MNSDQTALKSRFNRVDTFARSIGKTDRGLNTAFFARLMKTDAPVSVVPSRDDDDDALAIVDVNDTESPEFQKLWLLYNTSFPKDERRSLLEHEMVQDDPRFHFAAIHYEGLTVGLLGYWHLHDMIFIEHFAISPEFRSEGIGGRTIEHLQYYADCKIVLDVEPEYESSDAHRRVRFYTKHGFRYCKKTVVLPTYWFAKPIASNLMVWSPNKAHQTQKQILDDICRCIYGVADSNK